MFHVTLKTTYLQKRERITCHEDKYQPPLPMEINGLSILVTNVKIALTGHTAYITNDLLGRLFFINNLLLSNGSHMSGNAGYWSYRFAYTIAF